MVELYPIVVSFRAMPYCYSPGAVLNTDTRPNGTPRKMIPREYVLLLSYRHGHTLLCGL